MPIKKPTLDQLSTLIKDLDAWLKKRKGDSRSLLTELRDNLVHLDMALNYSVDLGSSLSDVSTAEYERLSSEGFNFNIIKRGKIRKRKDLEGTNLGFLVGKSTSELIESIYDKINELKIMYPKLRNSPKFRPTVRARNISERIIFLFSHVRK
ncbi:MAG: hypothetical protein F4Y34_01575 [Gammaproteobacteria bacterium]|nr:hypothetical protein [Gammaproteobacteria bacterium]MYH85856.1 hypothetical protein [Gammaproteobacteria bacterium]